MSLSALLAVLLFIFSLHAQEKGDRAPESSATPRTPTRSDKIRSETVRGKLDATAQRNENVAVYQIDNNAIKEANIRLGDKVTILSEAPVDVSYYATEHGRPAGEPVVLRPASPVPAPHGELYWWHQNSVFNARTFFQVGGVKPSRRNGYGGQYTGDLGKLGKLTANASQTKIRGMVNGNVLVPLASERTATAPDPATRALVTKFLAAYPATLPNRPDFDPRALNTNAPQRIDETQGTLRLDRETTEEGRLSVSHSLVRQRVDAFQFVAGQNPDTEIHSHRSRLTYRHAVSPASELALGFAYNRVKSVLMPEPNAVGPRVRMGYQIQELGPDSEFPIDRAQNTFRWGGLLTRQIAGGTHTLTIGGDVSRVQLNGIETNNQRGYFQFSNNQFPNEPPRTAIENFLHGTPTNYEVSVGELYRGFRNWYANAFFADRWRIHPRLQIYYGLRYSLETAPVEIHGLNQIPYGCDCNNFSPSVSIAYRVGAGWLMRSSYNVSFGQIPPVTYQQIRNNPPLVRYIQAPDPDLVNPLPDVELNSPTILSPDLVSPYAHQYTFTLEKKLLDRYQVRLGYIGSRTIKTINSFIMNRAEPVPGLELSTRTVNERRPDPRFYEVKNIVNGGIAYLDAAQFSLQASPQRGFGWGVTYTFGKAIDEGTDYSSTGANKDLSGGRNQWQYDKFGDRKGLSTFDSTHSMLLHYTYDLPELPGGRHQLGWLFNGWQISGATLVKSGTPFTLYVGSDAPDFGNVDGGPSDRPNILDPSILGRTVSDPNTSTLILRRDRFAFITPGDHRGSLGRSTFRRNGIANFNAAITKRWRWNAKREWTALLRAEAYNLTNHPQFDEPKRNLTSPSFGRITNTLNDGRIMQFSLRLIF
jgi:hypothetical protein